VRGTRESDEKSDGNRKKNCRKAPDFKREMEKGGAVSFKRRENRGWKNAQPLTGRSLAASGIGRGLLGVPSECPG